MRNSEESKQEAIDNSSCALINAIKTADLKKIEFLITQGFEGEIIVKNSLIKAIKKEDIRMLKHLIENLNLDINKYYPEVLKEVAPYINLEIMQYFSNQGINVRLKEFNILHYAIKREQQDIIKFFETYGVDINQYKPYKKKEKELVDIKISIENGEYDSCIINQLYPKPANPDESFICNIIDSMDLLIINAANEHKDKICKFIDERKKIIQDFLAATKEGNLEDVKFGIGCKIRRHAISKALIESVQGGSLNIVEFLIEYLSKNNNEYFYADDLQNKIEALNKAAQNGHLNVLKYLITLGVNSYNIDLNLIQSKEVKELIMKARELDESLIDAAKSGNKDKAKQLLESELGCSNYNKKQAFIIAASQGDLELLSLILKYKIELNEYENNYETNEDKNYKYDSLKAAVANGHLVVVKYLFNQDSVKFYSYKAHKIEELPTLAAESNHLEIVKYLIEEGIDANYYEMRTSHYSDENGDYDDKYPISETSTIVKAISSSNLQMVKYLFEEAHIMPVKEGHPEAFSLCLLDGFEIACQKGDLEMIKYLFPKVTLSYKDMIKIINSKIEVIRFLVENGLDIKLLSLALDELDEYDFYIESKAEVRNLIAKQKEQIKMLLNALQDDNQELIMELAKFKANIIGVYNSASVNNEIQKKLIKYEIFLKEKEHIRHSPIFYYQREIAALYLISLESKIILPIEIISMIFNVIWKINDELTRTFLIRKKEPYTSYNFATDFPQRVTSTITGVFEKVNSILVLRKENEVISSLFEQYINHKNISRYRPTLSSLEQQETIYGKEKYRAAYDEKEIDGVKITNKFRDIGEVIIFEKNNIIFVNLPLVSSHKLENKEVSSPLKKILKKALWELDNYYKEYEDSKKHKTEILIPLISPDNRPLLIRITINHQQQNFNYQLYDPKNIYNCHFISHIKDSLKEISDDRDFHCLRDYWLIFHKNEEKTDITLDINNALTISRMQRAIIENGNPYNWSKIIDDEKSIMNSSLNFPSLSPSGPLRAESDNLQHLPIN
jgi:hypothetical protein